jgi:dipeptidyl aminopeptidase/acylaminoacyl peptidase
VKRLVVVIATALALAVPSSPVWAAHPTENGRISFDSFRAGPDVDIWTMKPDGSSPRNLTAGSRAADFAAAWSPDGRRIVFLRNPDPTADDPLDTEIWVMRADGSGQKRITRNAQQDDQASWSPDGKRILFQRDPDGLGPADGELWLMRADGSRQRRLTNNRVDEIDPTFSPDGRRIAFGRDVTVDPQAFEFEIFDMRPSGRDVRRLTHVPGFDGGPAYSPDGRRLAFDSDRDGDSDIYLMGRNGGRARQLTGQNPAESAQDFIPSFSPDGRFITFDSDRVAPGTDNLEVFRMRSDGRREINLTRNPALDAGAEWQPLHKY